MYNLVHFWLFLIKFFISCAYRPNRGECSQHQPHKCQVDGTQPHGVVVLHRSVVSPVPGIFNLSDYVDPPSVPQTTGQRSTPPAPAWSAEQLQGAGHQQPHSVSDDVTEHERDEP